jgi:hypothetical protein
MERKIIDLLPLYNWIESDGEIHTEMVFAQCLASPLLVHILYN